MCRNLFHSIRLEIEEIHQKSQNNLFEDFFGGEKKKKSNFTKFDFNVDRITKSRTRFFWEISFNKCKFATFFQRHPL